MFAAPASAQSQSAADPTIKIAKQATLKDGDVTSVVTLDVACPAGMQARGASAYTPAGHKSDMFAGAAICGLCPVRGLLLGFAYVALRRFAYVRASLG